MNSKLYGKNFTLTSDILSHLEQFKSEESIKNILSSKQISYSNAKRIIGRMSDPNEKEKLGGEKFLEYLNGLLGEKRGQVERSAEHKSEYGGMQNQFRKAHNNNTKKIDTQQDLSVVESLQRINEIIKKLL